MSGRMKMGSKKHKAVVVLNHLLKGGRHFDVTFKGETSPRTLVLDEDYELCQLVKDEKGEVVKNSKGEEVVLRVFGVDMGPFVKLCEKLSDEEVFSIGCSTAFIEMANESDDAREAAAVRRAKEAAGG